MKKLFTLFACASLAFTLSAQDSEQAAGSYYLGAGDALDLVNIFGGDIEMSATIGYAVIDDLVVTGTIKNWDEDTSVDITLDLGVRYFWNGVFFQAGALNILSAPTTEEMADGRTDEMSISFGVGKYFSLGSVSDRFYVDPQINYNFTNGFETRIGLGCRF